MPNALVQSQHSQTMWWSPRGPGANRRRSPHDNPFLLSPISQAGSESLLIQTQIVIFRVYHSPPIVRATQQHIPSMPLESTVVASCVLPVLYSLAEVRLIKKKKIILSLSKRAGPYCVWKKCECYWRRRISCNNLLQKTTQLTPPMKSFMSSFTAE